MKYLWITLLTVLSCNVYAGQDPYQKDMSVNATVLFDNDSSVVSDDEKHKLTHAFQETPESATYNVNGYASKVGSKVHNLALSLRRAVAVKDVLGKPNVQLFKHGSEGAPTRPSILAARVDRKVEVQAVWSTYKPTFGYSKSVVPGTLFHLQGIEPGLNGVAISGIGLGIGI